MARTLDRTARLWVIEMLVEANPDRWEPTFGCGFTREGARHEVLRWREENRVRQVPCQGVCTLCVMRP